MPDQGARRVTQLVNAAWPEHKALTKQSFLRVSSPNGPIKAGGVLLKLVTP